MDTIPISQLIPIEHLNKYKLHAARSSDGTQPLDVYVESREEWLKWNRWRQPKNEFNREFIFSLIDFYPEWDKWLFGGIFRVIERKPFTGHDGYVIEEVGDYSNLVGRLKIHMPKPSRGRSFYLENHYSEMKVDEILRSPYSGARFPGFEEIVISFHELKSIITTEKPDWKGALMGVKGVYCIHDKSNGRKYIGSAYGDAGIWSRWTQYVNNGHGNNVHLRKVVDELGMDHVMKNFQMSLLEHRSTKIDDLVIIAREAHWKRLMLSRGDFGYNGN